jgi:hypothetical protein
VPFQERLLRLGGERDMERPARARQPQHEQPHLDQRPADGGVELAEVDFGLSAPGGCACGSDVYVIKAEFRFPAGQIPRHRHLRQARAVLGDQPLPPAGRYAAAYAAPPYPPAGQSAPISTTRSEMFSG